MNDPNLPSYGSMSRHPENLAQIRQAVSDEFGGATEVVYLRADICRRELDLEIEGICEVNGAAV